MVSLDHQSGDISVGMSARLFPKLNRKDNTLKVHSDFQWSLKHRDLKKNTMRRMPLLLPPEQVCHRLCCYCLPP